MAISARDRITRLTIYGNEADMIDDINGTDYTDGVVDGTQRFEHIKFNSLPGFGEANAAMYKCEISGTTDLTGKWIRVRYCFYDTDSATTRTVEAVFAGKVDSCKYDRYHISRSLVAYDKIYDLRNIDISDWWSNYWSTANDSTAFEVFDAMCTSFGVFHMLTSSDFRNNFTILKDAQKGRKLGGCSFADFLRYVGQINGFYWEVLPSGMLTCTAPTASYPQSFDTYTDFKETTIEDADAEAYGTFTVYDGADVIYTSGTGEPTYTFSNNILLYGHTTASLVSILDITKNYLVWFVGTRPATVEVIYSQIPERQAISVTDNGTPRTCVISKNEMWGAQLINQRLTCTGNRVIGTQYSSALNRAANDIQKIGVELTYKVNADNVIEAVNLEAQGGVTINAEAININGVISANNGFKVNLDGSVESTVGKIGGWIIDGEMLYKDVTISGTVYRVMLNAPTSPSLTTPAVVVRKCASGGSTWTDVSSILYSGKVISKDFEANGKVVIRPDASSQGTDKAINIIDGQLGTSLQGGLNVYYYNPTTNKTSYGRFASGTLFLGQADGDFRESNTPPEPSTADTIIGRFRLDVDGKDILRTHQSLVGGWGTAIPANANLNTVTYLKVGRYFCGSSASAASLSNCPTDIAFSMSVYVPFSSNYDDESAAWTYRVQRIFCYNGSEYVRMVNTNGSGVWQFGNWRRVVDTGVDEYSKLIPHLIAKYAPYVASGANLNTQEYLKIGEYNFTTAVAQSCSAYLPIATEGRMTVYSPTATTYNDEGGTWKYRVREYETYNGRKWRQFCQTAGTAGSWTFGAWVAVTTVDKDSYSNTNVKSGGLYARRQNNVVSVISSGDATNIPASTWTLYVTIASKYAPSDQLFVNLGNNANAQQFARFDTNGKVYLYSTTAITQATNFAFSVTYIVD